MNKPAEHTARAAFLLLSVLIWGSISSGAQTPTPAPGPAGAKDAPAVVRPVHPRNEVPVVQSAVSVDGTEAMFTTMCALLAAGYEADVSADHWSAYRA
jgi:hypothetical protein